MRPLSILGAQTRRERIASFTSAGARRVSADEMHVSAVGGTFRDHRGALAGLRRVDHGIENGTRFADASSPFEQRSDPRYATIDARLVWGVARTIGSAQAVIKNCSDSTTSPIASKASGARYSVGSPFEGHYVCLMRAQQRLCTIQPQERPQMGLQGQLAAKARLVRISPPMWRAIRG